MPLSRQTMIANTVDAYFERLNAHDLDGVMRALAPDCEMRIPSSNFTYIGADALRTHLNEFLETFAIVNFHNFAAYADVEQRVVALHFDIYLRAHDGEEIRMNNANFFQLNEAGLITDVLIFASAPLSKGFQAGSST
jgi:hypothetical protein